MEEHVYQLNAVSVLHDNISLRHCNLDLLVMKVPYISQTYLCAVLYIAMLTMSQQYRQDISITVHRFIKLSPLMRFG